MKNTKCAALFLLFTITIPTLPAVSAYNVLNNISSGISITYEADDLFEPGDITIRCGSSNSLVMYDSLKERETAAKIIALQNETRKIDQKIAETKEKRRQIDQETYNLYLRYSKKE